MKLESLRELVSKHYKFWDEDDKDTVAKHFEALEA